MNAVFKYLPVNELIEMAHMRIADRRKWKMKRIKQTNKCKIAEH